MKTATLVYKCRGCGSFHKEIIEQDDRYDIIIDVMRGAGSIWIEANYMPYPKLYTHHCDYNEIGIADLVHIIYEDQTKGAV